MKTGKQWKTDVLIVGAGISGLAIFRELTKWQINVLLIEKEADLARKATGHSAGVIDTGENGKKGSKKRHYAQLGNRMMGAEAEKLRFAFQQKGKKTGYFFDWQKVQTGLFCMKERRFGGIDGLHLVGKAVLREQEPYLNHSFQFAVASDKMGCVSPYAMALAYAENGVQNGGRILFETELLSLWTKDGHIEEAVTNRGIIYPKLVINCAGISAEKVAAIAGDRFYSLSYKRGTTVLLDKRTGYLLSGIGAWHDPRQGERHANPGLILKNPDGHLVIASDLVPCAKETKMDLDPAYAAYLVSKQRTVVGSISAKDVIGYSTGICASGPDDDFILERGRKVDNLIHVAGIDYPGLTAAIAFAPDVANMALQMLAAPEAGFRVNQETGNKKIGPGEADKDGGPVPGLSHPLIPQNPRFDPSARIDRQLRHLPVLERNRLIRKNPDYGRILSDSGEVSLGEFFDQAGSSLTTLSVRQGADFPSTAVLLKRAGLVPDEAAFDEACQVAEARIAGAACAFPSPASAPSSAAGGSSCLAYDQIYDVLVVGAGPAGKAAARTAAEGGRLVFLADKNPVTPEVESRRSDSAAGIQRIITGSDHFVRAVKKAYPLKRVQLVSPQGIYEIQTKSVVLATGALPATDKQMRIRSQMYDLAEGTRDLLPLSSLARRAEAALDPRTEGPVTDEKHMTSSEGIFACGSLIYADQNEEAAVRSGEEAGRGAGWYSDLVTDQSGILSGSRAEPIREDDGGQEERGVAARIRKAGRDFLGQLAENNQSAFQIRRSAPIFRGPGIRYFVPQRLEKGTTTAVVTAAFRPNESYRRATLTVVSDRGEVFSREVTDLRPDKVSFFALDVGAWLAERPNEFTVSLRGKAEEA